VTNPKCRAFKKSRRYKWPFIIQNKISETLHPALLIVERLHKDCDEKEEEDSGGAV
jgi:hypothetical protein